MCIPLIPRSNVTTPASSMLRWKTAKSSHFPERCILDPEERLGCKMVRSNPSWILKREVAPEKYYGVEPRRQRL